MTALSYEPRTGAATVAPHDSSARVVDEAVRRAAAVAREVGDLPPLVRAGWLEAIADALGRAADQLYEIADAETALGDARLRGEMHRATDALRFYAEATVRGAWLDATIDHASASRPDLRRLNRPLGPVAVFGASNFPFGFGVLGHDTATALAAGCPVVIKAHPAHPRLSAALAATAQAALDEAGAPGGVLQVVFGHGAGTQLVRHPDLRAVAFTGSERGGLALWREAATRARPIPVYAEMGTVNTVVVTRSAARDRGEALASEFVESFTRGMGQFCTKPGLLLCPSGSGMTGRIAAALRRAAPVGWLLTSAIADAYEEGVSILVDAGARRVTTTPARPAGWSAAPALISVDLARLTRNSPLLAEVFGPVAVVAEYDDETQLRAVLDVLPGSLAAGVQAAYADDPDVAGLVGRLSESAGRVVVNDWPTGVAVTWAQHHGGPWPATTVPSASSVGPSAIRRFVRPVAYQNVADDALPAALRDANPWGLPRKIDGR